LRMAARGDAAGGVRSGWASRVPFPDECPRDQKAAARCDRQRLCGFEM